MTSFGRRLADPERVELLVVPRHVGVRGGVSDVELRRDGGDVQVVVDWDGGSPSIFMRCSDPRELPVECVQIDEICRHGSRFGC